MVTTFDWHFDDIFFNVSSFLKVKTATTTFTHFKLSIDQTVFKNVRGNR